MSTRKPPDRRQRRATKDHVVELLPGVGCAPEASPGWSEVTAGEWAMFWGDEELRSIVRSAHLPALRRLFDWRDKLHRAWAEADAFRAAVGDDHLTVGSTGQPVVNPLYDLASKAEARALSIEGRIEAIEDRFGLTPGSMLRLGVDFQRQQSLQAANDRVKEAAVRAGLGRSSADDPRSLPGDATVNAS